MTESFFIEPSTGRKYSIEDAPNYYFSIEAVFNHKNYYINMDPSRAVDEINMEFEQDNTGEWEYVMIKNDEKKGEEEEENPDEEEDDDGVEGGNNEEEVLDMPPPWSPKLSVNKDKFLELCKMGEKTVFYKKCKVEFYSDCKQVDGLVKRVTMYEDFKRLITKEVRSYYRYRRDKLILRRRFPYEFKTIEHYESSEKTNHWKKLIQVDDTYRKIWFYHHRNKDGLIYREEQIKDKTFERYKGREDKLIYRSITYADETKSPLDKSKDLYIDDNNVRRDLKIRKMAQKFEVDHNKPAETQIKKTVFNIESGDVMVYYHYQEGKIFRQPTSYRRDVLISQGKTGEMNEKDSEETKEQQEYKFINNME